jgi:hypothetical protein
VRRTGQKEIEAVLRLEGPERFAHFVKRVVDDEVAWGLWKDGWALMANPDRTELFPLWPAREYAELCRIADWASYEPKEIALQDLISELATKLKERGVQPGIFPTPGGKGVTPTVDHLCAALAREMENYE